MRNPSRPAMAGGAKVGLLVLVICTSWLVIQNSILVLAMMWNDPALMARIAVAVLKAGALVGAKFWASPAAAALGAATLLALVLVGRPNAAGDEVRHG
jgi:hypothetical protein